MGDAACLTKPHAGEGVTSSMVQADIAVDVVDALLKSGKSPSRENLWPVNKRYYDGQGKVYAGMLATLVGAVATNERENEYFFRHDIIFSARSFDAMAADQSLSFSAAEMAAIAVKMLWGVVTFRIRIKTILSLLTAMGNGDTISKLYAEYPAEAAGFEAWRVRAEAAWARTPGMADIQGRD